MDKKIKVKKMDALERKNMQCHSPSPKISKQLHCKPPPPKGGPPNLVRLAPRPPPVDRATQRASAGHMERVDE